MADFKLNVEKVLNILGEENIQCLENLFKSLSGMPHQIDKKRYRADNPSQIQALEELENKYHLIKIENIDTNQFYRIRSYALPLIKLDAAQIILNNMCSLYKKFPDLYKKHLDDIICREEFFNLIPKPKEDIINALYYFRDIHDVWGGWGLNFPYEEKSHINISEKVLIRADFLEIIQDYYRWNFTKKEIAAPAIKAKRHENRGKKSYKHIINDAYKVLRHQSKIDFSKPLTAHVSLINETVQVIQKSAKNPHIRYNTIWKHIGEEYEKDAQSYTGL